MKNHSAQIMMEFMKRYAQEMQSKNTTALIMHAYQEQFPAHFPALTEYVMAQDGQNAYEMMEEHAKKSVAQKEWNVRLIV